MVPSCTAVKAGGLMACLCSTRPTSSVKILSFWKHKQVRRADAFLVCSYSKADLLLFYRGRSYCSHFPWSEGMAVTQALTYKHHRLLVKPVATQQVTDFSSRWATPCLSQQYHQGGVISWCQIQRAVHDCKLYSCQVSYVIIAPVLWIRRFILEWWNPNVWEYLI